jgi:Asp-tRNA(Asn)/Glu-tRNA(Gln) amidotransferase B subunit
MVNLDDLETDVLVPRMISKASDIAGPLWEEIRTTATHEFKVLASRIREIGSAVRDGELSQTSARILLRMARRNLIATLAMLTIMIDAAVQKLVNGVLSDLKDHVNTAMGFSLL